MRKFQKLKFLVVDKESNDVNNNFKVESSRARREARKIEASKSFSDIIFSTSCEFSKSSAASQRYFRQKPNIFTASLIPDNDKEWPAIGEFSASWKK